MSETGFWERTAATWTRAQPSLPSRRGASSAGVSGRRALAPVLRHLSLSLARASNDPPPRDRIENEEEGEAKEKGGTQKWRMGMMEEGKKTSEDAEEARLVDNLNAVRAAIYLQLKPRSVCVRERWERDREWERE